jgi:hypothetical protein
VVFFKSENEGYRESLGPEPHVMQEWKFEVEILNLELNRIPIGSRGREQGMRRQDCITNAEKKRWKNKV